MRKYISSLGAFVLAVVAGGFAANAQPRYISVVVDAESMTYGSARINWKLDQPSTSVTAFVEYGTDKKKLDAKSGNRTGGTGVDRGAWLGGLQPNTRYYFRPITADTSGVINTGWGCSSKSSVSQGTLAGGSCETSSAVGDPPSFVTPSHPGESANTPELPRVQVDTTVPFPTVTYPVITKCSELPSALLRAVADSASAVPAIDVDENVRCKDVLLPKKTTTNRILVRVRNADVVLPPANTRIGEPGSVGTPRLPQFTTSGSASANNASIRAFSSCDSNQKGCDPQKVCGSPYCSRGWYFLGIDFTTEDSLRAQAAPPLPLVDVRTNGKILRLLMPGHNLAPTDHIVIDQLGGFNQPIAGIYPIYVTNPTEVWISFPETLSGTWDGTGRVMYYVSQPIHSLVCSSGTDCVVDVGSGNFHGLQSGTIVTPYLTQGLTGLGDHESVSGSYWITRLDAQRFRLNGTAGKVHGTHVAGSGYYFIDNAIATLGRFNPDSADIVVARSFIRTKFPQRAQGMTFHGDQQAIVDSHLDVTAWVPIDPNTGKPAPQVRTILQHTPIAVNCAAGVGKKLENNLIRGHGILVFCSEGPESEPGVKMAADITIRRNTFHVPPALNTSQESSKNVFPRVYFHHRHSFELKRGTRVLIEGNLFDGGYSGEQINQPMIGLSPRHTQPQSLATNFVSDITITNNVFRFGVTVLAVIGSDYGKNVISPMNVRRVLFQNNVVYGMNWTTNRSKPSGPGGSYAGPPGSTIGGVVFQLSNYPQDIHIKKNTFFDSRGSGPAFLDLYDRVTGLIVEDNLITYHRGVFDLLVTHPGSVNFGPDLTHPASTSLARAWSDVTQNTGRFRNVLIRGTKDASGRCHGDSSVSCNITQQECESRLGTSSTFTASCFGTGPTATSRFDEVGFFSWETFDFRLRSDSKVLQSSLMLEPGADIGRINQALAGEYTQTVGGSNSSITTTQAASPDVHVEATVPAASTISPSGDPAVDILQPLSGNGTSNTFTAVFSHSGGASQHYLGYLLFLPSPNVVSYTAKSSCLIEHNRISNGIRLINDAGNDWLGPASGIPIGPSAGSLGNGQCTVNVAGATVSVAGNKVTLNVPVTFRSGLTSTVATFLQGFDVKGNFTGMTQFGNWFVGSGTSKPGPAVVNAVASSTTGKSATYTLTATHTSGASALAMITLLISSDIVGGTPCQVFFFPSTRTLNVVNNSGAAMVSQHGLAIGSPGTVGNSRCSIDSSLASQSVSGNNVTISFPMTFQASAFAGQKKVYVNVFDAFGQLSHWINIAALTI